MSTVTEYLSRRDFDFWTYEHDPAQTATAEARILGMSPKQVAKTLVLDTAWGHALAVIPASTRLDLSLASEATGDPDVTLATEREIATDFHDYELGAIPPLPDLLSAPVYLDEQLARHDTIIFASGKRDESVKMLVADLLDDGRVMVAPLCQIQLSFDEDWME